MAQAAGLANAMDRAEAAEADNREVNQPIGERRSEGKI